MGLFLYKRYARMKKNNEAVAPAAAIPKEKPPKEEAQEFGGAIGATALIIWSHYILLYFW